MPSGISGDTKVADIFVASFVEVDFEWNRIFGFEVLMAMDIVPAQCAVELRTDGDNV